MAEKNATSRFSIISAIVGVFVFVGLIGFGYLQYRAYVTHGHFFMPTIEGITEVTTPPVDPDGQPIPNQDSVILGENVASEEVVLTQPSQTPVELVRPQEDEGTPTMTDAMTDTMTGETVAQTQSAQTQSDGQDTRQDNTQDDGQAIQGTSTQGDTSSYATASPLPEQDTQALPQVALSQRPALQDAGADDAPAVAATDAGEVAQADMPASAQGHEAQATPDALATSATPASDEMSGDAADDISDDATSDDTVGVSSGYRIQLASVDSRAGAEREWQRLAPRLEELLAEARPRYQSAQVRGVTWYRIQVPVDDLAAGQALCEQIKSRQIPCLVLAP
ncbi:MAG: SPOR domain-containing protein [Pseudomonadota bacterium]